MISPMILSMPQIWQILLIQCNYPFLPDLLSLAMVRVLASRKKTTQMPGRVTTFAPVQNTLEVPLTAIQMPF